MSPCCDMDRAAVDALDRRWRGFRVVDRETLLQETAAVGGRLGTCLSRARELAELTLTDETAKKWQAILDILLAAPADAAIGSDFGPRMAEDAAAHRAISRAISEMVATDGPVFDALDVAESLGRLRLALPALETPGHVQILDADSVGSRRYDAVILFDLSASGFPVTDRESLEEEMHALLGQEPTSRAAQSRSDFYGLLTRARQRLYLVRQTCDAAGEPVAASPAWDALLDLYRPQGAQPDELALEPPPLVEVSLEDLASWAPVFSAGRRTQRMEAGSIALPSVERGALASETAIQLLSQRETFLVTEVETYLQCPYRWFYDRVVRPHEIDSRFDGRELGTRAHRYLAAFYERLPEEMAVHRMSDATLAAGLELFDRVSQEVSADMASPSSISEELMAARGLELARQVVADDTLMFPQADSVEPEVSFDELEFAGGRFKGRADRIDTGPTALFVTDYKTSSTVYGHEKFAAHGLIQAVLYGVAASVYRSIRARRCRGFWRTDLLGATPARCSDADGLDEQGFQALVESTEERVANAVRGMREGSIPRSQDAAACKFCSIANICRNGGA